MKRVTLADFPPSGVARNRCPSCNGRGWVSDGQPEDGRMTGRKSCPTCKDGFLADEAFLAYVARVMEGFHVR